MKVGNEYEDSGMIVIVAKATNDDGMIELNMTEDGKLVNEKGWCECGGKESFYWADWIFTERHGIDRLTKRYHGWACKKCRKITQVG